MEFSSEVERLNDPKAGLIPCYIWNDMNYFQRSLSVINSTFLRPHLYLNNFLNQSYNDLSFVEKNCALISVLICYPNAPLNRIISFAKRLDINQENLFRHYCILGYTWKI